MSEGKVPRIRFPGFADLWEQRKLGDMVSFSKGSGYSKGDLKADGTPIILYGRLYTKYETVISEVDTFVDEKNGSVYSKGGEVIVPASGETAEDISIAAVVEKSGVLLGGDLNVITPPDDMDSAFLAISISNGKPHNDMSKMAQGKSVVHLHNSDLAKIDLPYPSYDEQRKISGFFSYIDNLITLHQRKCDKWKELKKGMLQKMFPKEGESVPEIRFPGFSDHWIKIKLSDIGIATSGTAIESEFSEDGSYKVISIGSYSEDSTYRDQGIRALNSEKTRKRILYKDDLTMLLNDKTSEGNIIGRVLLIDEDEKYVYNQRTQRIEVDKDKYDPVFLYEMLNAPNIREKIIRQSQGNTQIYVNWSVISQLDYLVPCKEEQIAIGSFFSMISHYIMLLQNQLAKWTKMRKGLLQQMFVA